ncbi:pseudaminic acid cytidylyltransferase [Alteromonas sp. 5E99-2]|uniref:pseudaminic acid cytidylyltransferase n=1 Tax=Alteromonas sp. 5E99-2 TaxID=2817683 RepID=UPI001A99658C|nr:pseudaminic acid cytidylyltransferase [Alteromonas sp. 5E99-2]MBO1255244.1 pseudaminic acid cytidylyltransferase [Alteromonas sp. 5E99-2]
MNKKNIAIIPARGGSKRIPKKNIRCFAGKPLIAYSIEAAISTALFDAIVVSTDDSEIAKIAKESGATVIIERPTSLADDKTGTMPVVEHGIKFYENHFGEVDNVCCIYATAPFLTGDWIKKGFEKLTDTNESKFAFSVTSFDFPIQRALKLSGSGVLPVTPSAMGCRSQDLAEMYHDAGQFYWGSTSAWLNKLAMFSEHSIPVVLPRYLVQDIDTYEDWTKAELMYEAYIKSKYNKSQYERD